MSDSEASISRSSPVLAAYRVARPVRAVVLVNLPDKVPWQIAMIAALRAQTITWGGAGNLLVPWTPDLLERREFWAICRALDPDVVLVNSSAAADVIDLLPDLGASEDEAFRVRAREQGFPEQGIEDALTRARREPVDVAPAKALLTTLAQRLPLLQRSGRAVFKHASARTGSGFPCVGVTQLADRPAWVGSYTLRGDADLQLLLATEQGDVHPEAAQALRVTGTKVSDWPGESGRRGALQTVFGQRASQAPPAPFALSELGLRWFSPAGEPVPRPTVVVGDDPWDFCLAYALRRLTGVAWWLPSAYASEDEVLDLLSDRVSELAEGAEGGNVVSLSDAAATERAREGLEARRVFDFTWRHADATELFERPPNQLLTGPGGLESFPLVEGSTGHLPPQLPKVRASENARLYWMAELDGTTWQPLPDGRISDLLVRDAPGYRSSVVRPTLRGVAYLCPHFLRAGPEDLEGETVRPRLAVLSMHEMLAAILSEENYRLVPSDKGRYAEQSGQLIGGTDELHRMVDDPAWMTFLASLRSPAERECAGGWALNDGRLYFTFAEIDARLERAALSTTSAGLVESGLLRRGLVYKCPLCLLSAFYEAEELGFGLRCARCRRPFSLSDPGWIPAEEPVWRYRLAEILWQLLEHNGDLPLRALRQHLGFGTDRRIPRAMLHEHEVVSVKGGSPIELDICAQRGSELWIGEAKIAASMGSSREEVRKLKGLAHVARLLRPAGVLLVTAAEQWSQRTADRATEILGDLPLELRLATSPPPARPAREASQP